MKFLIDQQLPPALAGWIAGKGHDAQNVRDVGLRDGADAAIWAYAHANGLIVVTKDEDFAARRARQDGPAILWLRLGNATNRTLFVWLAPRWAGIEHALAAGASLVEAR